MYSCLLPSESMCANSQYSAYPLESTQEHSCSCPRDHLIEPIKLTEEEIKEASELMHTHMH